MEDAETITVGEGEEKKTEKQFYTLDEYRAVAEPLQKNKDGKLVILYTTDPVQQDGYVKAATAKGFKVIVLNTLIDTGFINQAETKWENVVFTRVDADIADNLIDKQEKNESVLSKDDTEKLKGLFSFQAADMMLQVEVKGLSKESAPVIATRPEQMRRMKDMGAMGGGMTAFYAMMPDEVHLTVNGNHPIFQSILQLTDTTQQTKQVRNLADLALLSQGLLKGAELTNFINRSVELMEK